MQVVTKPISEIHPYWRNPRHNEEAIEKCVDSINRYGFNQPLVVDETGTIIAGHSRYMALRRLEYEEVPVVVAELSAEKAKEYRIADNKVAEFSEWDEDALLAELRELDPDTMQTFFQEDVSALLDASVGGDMQPPQATGRREPNTHNMSEGDQVEITCPHCGETMYVSRSDVERRTDENTG